MRYMSPQVYVLCPQTHWPGDDRGDLFNETPSPGQCFKEIAGSPRESPKGLQHESSVTFRFEEGRTSFNRNKASSRQENEIQPLSKC